MGLPPNVRVNAQLPFPSMVTGGSGIAISKNNGIWVVSIVAGYIASILQSLGFLPSFTGSSTVNFGLAPGTSDTQLVVTGQPNILAGSSVAVWIAPAATADHSVDEHWVDPPTVSAGNIVPGVGFTIFAKASGAGGTADILNAGLGAGQVSGIANSSTAYGAWNVGWRWQ